MPEVWTVKKILDWTSGYFAEKQIPEPRLGAELLLADVLQCQRISLYVQFERILSSEERQAYRAYVKKRADGEPVQYILGETEFMGLPFVVRPGVLIPRPDSEHLVDRVLDYCRKYSISAPRVLDLGTGSGCLAISIAKLLPGASVTAVDLMPEALQIARSNATANSVEINFVQQDMRDLQLSGQRSFDVVISNPPYIREAEWQGLQQQVRDFEPREALLAGVDGLIFYRSIVGQADDLLAQNGRIFLETGHDQGQTVQQLLQNAGFNTYASRDYQQIERVVEAWKSLPFYQKENNEEEAQEEK